MGLTPRVLTTPKAPRYFNPVERTRVRIRQPLNPVIQDLPGGKYLTVFDDFYANPEEIERRIRSGRRFTNAQGNPQVDADLDVAPLLEFLRDFVAQEFVAGSQNYFGHTAADDDAWYVHADEFDWTALCYLGHPPPGQKGITFFRHRGTGVMHCPEKAERLFDQIQSPGEKPWQVASRDGYVPENWESLATVAYRYNRCLLFPPRLYHRGELGWGKSLQDCRLSQSIGLVMQNPWTVRL